MSKLLSVLELCICVIYSLTWAKEDNCRILKYKPVVQGYSLQGHGLKSFELKREIDCTAGCFVEHNCMSFNTGLLDGSGTYLCELSNSDHEMHSEALKPKYGFTYHATENACIKNPCSPNAVCQNGFTDKGYRCMSNGTNAQEFPSSTARNSMSTISKPTSTISQAKSSISQLTSFVSHPKSIVSQPTSIVSQPKSSRFQPTRFISQPKSIVSQLKSFRSQPKSSISQPKSRIFQLTSMVSQPTSNISQPTSTPSEPKSTTYQPTRIVSEPTSIISQPTSNIYQSTSTISESKSTISQPKSTAFQPTTIISQPTSSISKPLSIAPPSVLPSSIDQRSATWASALQSSILDNYRSSPTIEPTPQISSIASTFAVVPVPNFINQTSLPIYVGQNKDVFCPVSARGNSSVFWMHQNSLVLPDGILIEGSLVLKIISADFNHSGNYTCIVENVNNQSDTVLQLTVHVTYPDTCSRVRADISDVSGDYVIDPDGSQGTDPFVVYCNMTDKGGVGVTVVSHDSENRTHVNGCKQSGCYSRNVSYLGASLSQLSALTEASAYCEQFISYECHGAKLFEREKSWWVSRDGVRMKYWGGATNKDGYCACGVTGNCARSGRGCNCDADDAVWREDSGLLTNKTHLPVSQLRFGDTNGSEEEGYHLLGKLICYEII